MPVENNDPDALNLAGQMAFKKKDYKEAVNQYTMAIEKTQEKPNALYFDNRAFAYLRMNLFAKCIADCDQALLIDPEYAKAYERKARAQITNEDLDDALATLKEALEKNPGNDFFKMMMEMVVE